MTADLHHIEIINPTGVGRQTDVRLDGRPVHGLMSIKYEASVDSTVKVTLVLAAEVTAKGYARVVRTSAYDGLTERQVEILRQIAEGKTNKAVAHGLSISEQTVKNHVTAILRSLGVPDRTAAVVYAMRHGWIAEPPPEA